jgi:two-component sensor histidine kinase
LNDFIRRRVVGQPRSLVWQAAIAAACILAATALRMALSPVLGSQLPYITFFPAVMVAGILGGLRSGVLTLAGSTAVAAYVFVGGQRAPTTTAEWIGIVTFLLSSGLIVWLCDVVSRAVRDLGDANRQEHLLVLELQHRVKNTLTIIQALAAQTFNAAGDGPEFKAAFTDRLIALGQAHNLLSEGSWREVTMEVLATRTVAPFVTGGEHRLKLAGAIVKLPSDLVVDLALVLHELATNATKYGALSNEGGHVDVHWRKTPATDARIELIWREVDGPPVTPPTRRGFGSRLLERGLSRRYRPDVSLAFPPAGLVWRVEFDAA